MLAAFALLLAAELVLAALTLLLAAELVLAACAACGAHTHSAKQANAAIKNKGKYFEDAFIEEITLITFPACLLCRKSF